MEGVRLFFFIPARASQSDTDMEGVFIHVKVDILIRDDDNVNVVGPPSPFPLSLCRGVADVD